MKNLNDVREGIWVLAVIAFLSAMGFMTMSLQIFSLSDVFRGTVGLPLADPATGVAVGYITSGQFLGIGFALVILSLFSYFVGKNLLKAKKWSKIAAGVVAAIIAIVSIVLLINKYFAIGFAGAAIAGLQIWYLFFSKSTKKYFKK
ncbi:hypothetical protein KAS08_01275 [Candidatus Pacearchaeota archaeon]|nr:hypothetical protein [Candidatus Pacearchaeota archaeon]